MDGVGQGRRVVIDPAGDICWVSKVQTNFTVTDSVFAGPGRVEGSVDGCVYFSLVV